MASVNKVIILGNLGDDVKLHYFDDKSCIGRFPVATSRSYKDRNGNQVDQTEWHNIVVRNRVAENCEKYLSKGDSVYVEGRIQSRSWDDQNGQTRYTTEIVALTVQFLSTKRSDGNSSAGSTASPSTNQTNQVQEPSNQFVPPPPEPTDADDLPF